MWSPAILLAVFVALAPFALGSNRPLPWGYNAIGAGLCLLIALGMMQFQPDRFRVRWSPLRIPLALTCIVAVWIGVQTIPLGLEGLAHPNWQYAAELLGSDLAGTITVNPNLTINAATRLTTYLAVFLTAYIVSQDRQIADVLIKVLVVASGLYALYGLISVSFSFDRLLWFERPPGDYLTATFVGRNSAATYFGLGSIAVFALIQRQLRRDSQADAHVSWRMRVANAVTRLSGLVGFAFVLFAMLFSTILATGSRAGIAFTILALGTLLLLQFLRIRQSHHSFRASGMARFGYVTVLLVVVFVLLEMAGAHLTSRLVSQGVEAKARLVAYADTLKAIGDNPLLGTGYGTFEDIYPLYRSSEQATGIWDKAHNDYLELFLGLGVPAALLFLAALAILVMTCVRGVFSRRRDAHYPMIAVAASILVGFHSLVDFSLQIQAVAMTYAMILGIGTAQSIRSSR